MALIIAVFFVIVVTILIYLQWPAWKLSKIPAAPYISGLGHLPLMAKYQAGVFIKLAKQLGPIYRFQLGRQPIVFVASADLCQEIAIRKFKVFPNRVILPYMKESWIHLHGLFMTKAPDWARMRNILLPTFHTEKLSAYVPLMERVMGQVVEILDKHANAGEDVNMTQLLQRMALDVIGESAFGTGFKLVKPSWADGRSEDKDMVNAVLNSLDTLTMSEKAPVSTFAGLFFPFLQHPIREIMKRIPGTGDWNQYTGNLLLEAQMRALLERREAEMRDGVVRSDALSLLLDARAKSQEMRELLTDERVLALAYELMMAGSESTGTNLCYTLYFIAAHPEVASKMVKEIDELAPLGSTVAFEDVDKFKYVDQVIKESMRMITFSPVVAREAMEDIKVVGYHIPKVTSLSLSCRDSQTFFYQGTWVWLVINALAQDEEDFPEPHLFRPERFDPDCAEAKKRHPYAHSPFGIGPRMCIGYKLAYLEMKLALIHFYQRYTFEHSPAMENPLAVRLSIVVRPIHGVKLRVRKRGIC
ncbi:cytochrome P450 711A1 isoform X1 [Selaginella moellendorffii]|uniref:cytochrome P450 711A1 isoform X1 n=1 Tax=Selaginella moellendorffii TaxID=88036 RepID=UPI000D1CB8E5|nr:cytochrome P450 711A1 isoform X1 [Selaginella moellendorffii]|eukprot:XP_024532645.1 cytochrome P450 711A1 isoform X1 [Selaginella moellendorffii]